MKKSTFKFLTIAMFFFMGTYVMAQTQYEVTFNVDMTGVEAFNPDTDDIFMSGDFAGWATPGDDATTKMEPLDVGSMIYTLTVSIDSGMVQYKYFRVIDGASSWDNGEWTGTDNRVVFLREGKTFDNAWANRPTVVTFEVDMTDADPFDPATDAVYMAGTLASGWAQPGTMSDFMMTPTDGNEMVYGIELSLYNGNYDYKYFRVIDGAASWDHGEDVPNDRTVAIDTAQSEIVISDIWSDIDAGIFDEPNQFTYSMYPNPVLTVLNIDNTSDVSQIDVFDATGRIVRTVEVTTEKVVIDVADLQTGVYIISVTNEKGSQSSKFVKN